MYNKVVSENPLRKVLKLIIILLVFLIAIFIAGLILMNIEKNNTYNGQTAELNGIVKNVVTEDDTTFITLQNSNRRYNVTDVAEKADWNSLKGKNVTIFIPQNQSDAKMPLLLGISVDGKVIVDTQETLNFLRQDIENSITPLTIVLWIFAVNACALIIWRINSPRLKEYPLAQKFTDFYAPRQPLCPERRWEKIFIYVWSAILVAIIAAMTIINSIEEQSDTVNLIFLGIFAAVGIVGFVGMLVLSHVFLKKEIAFYAEHFPFDFNDVSHIRFLRKTDKEKIQQELKKRTEEYPHRYADGGNGYLVEFTETGIDLFPPDIDDYPNDETAGELPQNVFDELADSEQTAQQDSKTQPILQLTYSELNFEAVPIYKKRRPLFIVVKSRLQPDEKYPEELVNDIHFILDINLLATLRTFDVHVENLQNILDNKLTLMQENCLHRKKQKM